VIQFLCNNLGIQYDATNQTVLAKRILTSLQTEDCVAPTSYPLSLRNHWSWESIDPDCVDECPTVLCEDQYCTLPDECRLRYYDTCLKIFILHESTREECLGTKMCNWNGELCDSDSDCDELCQPTNTSALPTNNSHFCGYCDGSKCTEVSEVDDATACQNTNVCVLPNGTYILGLTQPECTSLGQCTVECSGSPCTSIDQCINSGTNN
jgi:hypothetical protein